MKNKSKQGSIAVIGGGNIGASIARGFAASGEFSAAEVMVTRRQKALLEPLEREGFSVSTDNREAARRADVLVLAVGPHQLEALLKELRPALTGKHLLISIVSGVTTAQMRAWAGPRPKIIRAMTNTAIAIREGMTSLCAAKGSEDALPRAKELFDQLGCAIVINEELMLSATALSGCGIAFFLRAIRAASQGGIQIGFHSEQAIIMAAQTAKGAAALLLSKEGHPEGEIDKVTTPRGCTIEGLNEMEHYGFSSAMIRGIVTSSDKAAKLFKKD